MNEEKPISVCYDGAIGSGKSTAVAYTEALFGENIAIMPEPLKLWQNLPDYHTPEKKYNLLDLVYTNPRSNFFPFQSYVFTTMAEQTVALHSKPGNEEKFKVSKRSLHDARYIFTELGWKEGLLSDRRLAILHSQYELLLKMNPALFRYDALFYFKVTSSTSISRVQSRGRSEEKCVAPEYLRAVVEQYEDFFDRKNPELNIFPNVFRINADLPLKDVQAQVKYHLQDTILRIN